MLQTWVIIDFNAWKKTIEIKLWMFKIGSGDICLTSPVCND